MRKIKECICNSTERTIDNVYPICLGCFLVNMANILLVDASQRLMSDVPTISLDSDEYDGQKKEKPTINDIICIWNGNDLMRHLAQDMQLQHFLDWFMEQDEPEDETYMWYDIEFLVEKWNQFVKEP